MRTGTSDPLAGVWGSRVADQRRRGHQRLGGVEVDRDEAKRRFERIDQRDRGAVEVDEVRRP
ncbi:MAG TPA: hypothetical protein PLX85_06625, partial [Dehalococcoidia bacterium]|nr:hypothetical protein [Dehalococcoidia bacterium]